MLKAYKFYSSDHMKLHSFMMEFFHNITNHRSTFNDTLIPSDFLPIAKAHKRLIYNRLIKIHGELNKLDSNIQKEFCERASTSNNIKQSCERTEKPLKLIDIPTSIRETLISLFLSLYTQILRRDNTFSNKYGTIREHFKKFRELNSEITVCPFCGISELKTEFDISLEQYDHYFPKTLYPLSSVNFENLVPTCKDCNGLDCKTDKDILELGVEKVFFPYETAAQDIEIKFAIIKKLDIKDWDWTIDIKGETTDVDEKIISWDKIYDIKSRYLAHVKGRISKWVNMYTEFKRKAIQRGQTEQQIKEMFLLYLETEEEFGVNYLRKPAFDAYFIVE